MSIFPYVYKMVEHFNITEDKSKISVYAGMITSAFTLAEFSTGVVWGRLSDKIGRKPVLLMGLFGTALSSLVFGFAPNLTVALIARALGGLLNGYVEPTDLLMKIDHWLTLAKKHWCPANDRRRAGYGQGASAYVRKPSPVTGDKLTLSSPRVHYYAPSLVSWVS